MVDGKTIIVTGSGSGIGLGIVQLLIERGANVAGISLEETPVDSLRLRSFVGDTADEGFVHKAVAQAADAFGGIDGVVCNAGIMNAGAIDAFETTDFEAHLRVNVMGMAFASRAAFPFMKEAGGGSIVICSSIMAYTAAPQSVAYTTSKTAALGLMRAIAMDGAPHGIRCNAICPGTIRTGMLERYLNRQEDPGEVERAMTAKMPLGRLGKPRDIASVAAFLLSEESAYMTGAELIVDGGFRIRGTND